MTNRRPRTDSITGQVQAMQGAAKLHRPPAYLSMREEDLPHWDALMRTRATASWTPVDLCLAVVLCRTLADIEKLQTELNNEGYLVTNRLGSALINKKFHLVETLTKRVVAYTRLLQLHPNATQGKSREQRQVNKEHATALAGLDRLDDDGLIKRPN